jgi:ABC-2 type transport system permease protein
MSGAAYVRPGALGGDLKRFWSLTWTLAVTDWKLRFYGSALGYLWSLVRPFLLFGVIYVVFVEFVDLGRDVRFYPAYILLCIVLFEFFADTTSGALGSLVNRENLLRKVRFPRLVIPLSVAVTSILNLGMTMVAVMVFATVSGARPRAGWLWLPVLVAIVAVFAVGVGMLLSALFVRYRDIQPIWEVATRALFYGSPVLYVTAMVPESVRALYSANPLASVMNQLRHSVLDPTAPSAADYIGGYARLLIPGGIVVAACLLGWLVFRREAPRIAENL